MSKLITIKQQTIGDDKINAVSARDLHSGLELKKDFTDWVKNILPDFIENIDFIEVHSKVNINNVKMTEYLFSIDMAKQVAMLTRTAKGKEIRLYFIECEKKALNKPISTKQIKSQEELYLEILTRDTTTTITKIMHRLNGEFEEHGIRLFNIAADLNNFLQQVGMQVKINNTWTVTEKYRHLNIYKYVELPEGKGNFISLQWNEAGYELMKAKIEENLLTDLLN